MIKLVMVLFGICLSVHVQAFPCFITLVKDECWTNYDLTVIVKNTSTQKPVMKLTIPQGKSWARQQFDCQPKDSVAFSATYTPIFWEGTEDKVYLSKRDWTFPETIATGSTAWNMTVCYSSEFAEVALPPEASGNCKCNTDIIPAIKPQ